MGLLIFFPFINQRAGAEVIFFNVKESLLQNLSQLFVEEDVYILKVDNFFLTRLFKYGFD